MVIWLARLMAIVVSGQRWVAQVATDVDRVAGEIADESEVTKNAAPLIEQLTPLNQIRVFTGLFTIIILGLVIFLVIKAGAHMWRGLSAAANRLPAKSVPSRDDWARKPLNEAPSDHANSEEDDGS